MRDNRKGMTLVEIIVAISLISIVLIFLMTLFVKVRATYNQSKAKADFDMLVANTIKTIGNDIDNYGLRAIEYENEGEKKSVKLTFNAFRQTHLSDRIVKVLRMYFKNNMFYISYAYESKYTVDITSAERISGVVRELPVDAVVDSKNYIELEKYSLGIDELAKIKIPIEDEKGNRYDINIYGLIKGEDL